MFKQHNLTIFLILAALKGIVEAYAGRHQNRGGVESSQKISRYFVVLGVLTPVLIFIENVFLLHSLPLAVSIVMAVLTVALMILRVVCIHTLGKFYSVNIRITDKHKLVRTGIYHYFRHPIYLIGLLDNFFYPMAAGAYISTILLVGLGTPLILMRRQQEEAVLLERFGQEYAEYQKCTWF